MRKDKIFELRIDDEDELSGIDSISLVDEPAIEVNWIAFNKEKEHEFVVPEGEDLSYSERILAVGQLEEELFSEGWELVSEDFISSFPNANSIEDTNEYLVRYKYVLNPEAPGAPVKETTREFCRDLLAKNFVYRVEDLEKITNDLGSSAMVWRGSYNCRHIWKQIRYQKDAKIINKGSVTKGRIDGAESYDILDYPQPDTRTSHPSFAKEGFMKVSLDYDGTLSTNRGQQLALRLKGQGDQLYIVTARSKSDALPVYTVADQIGIPRSNIYFTNGQSKWKTLTDLGIKKHYDNNPNVVEDIRKHTAGIQIEKFDYNVGSIGGYVDPGIKKKKKLIEKGLTPPTMFETHFRDYFESYSDYPESVKNNAKAVLKYVDENGWGSCGTDVGKQRANQLANGEAISLDTIKRMYSYLSRHEGDLDSSKGYGDGCGKLMYDAWGGKTALRWAESKINAAENQSMSKQYFAIDNEEKRIVLGPAMIPDLKIFRKDKLGNPYYVYFSTDTIRMIAEKYMRNKYIDNNDQMHDGKAVSDVYVVESWIKEDENDKSVKYGYGDLPVGTWFVSMKIKNDNIWQKVKNHELNGFSVSGFFEEVAAFCREEAFLKEVAKILKDIKE
jgi:hypothetical protein